MQSFSFCKILRADLSELSFFSNELYLQFCTFPPDLYRAFRYAGRKHGNTNTRAIISGTEVDFSAAFRAGYRRFRYLSVFIKGPHTTLSFTFHRAKLDANADWIPTNPRFDESAVPILPKRREKEYGFYSISGKFLGFTQKRVINV